jgi:hypothetical protein
LNENADEREITRSCGTFASMFSSSSASPSEKYSWSLPWLMSANGSTTMERPTSAAPRGPDAFAPRVRDAARLEHEAVHGEETDCEQQHDDDGAVDAPPGDARDGLLGRDLAFPPQALRRQLVHPREDQRRHEAEREHHHDRARHPARHLEQGQQRRRDLDDQPRADEIQARHADDVAAPEFGNEAHRGSAIPAALPAAGYGIRSPPTADGAIVPGRPACACC